MSMKDAETAQVGRAAQGSVPDWLVRDTAHLALTQNRIAIRYRKEAEAYEASGNRRLYTECLLEARNYSRKAKAHLQLARNWSRQ